MKLSLSQMHHIILLLRFIFDYWKITNKYLIKILFGKNIVGIIIKKIKISLPFKYKFLKSMITKKYIPKEGE